MAELVIKLVNGDLAGQTAQTIAKNVNDAALALKKAEVGTQAWVDASKKLDDVKEIQADYKTQLDATSKASDTLKKSFTGILDQIPGFSQISGAMRSATSGVGGLSSGFGVLKGAIAATGIGLLVIAVATLVGWLSKTETGANVLAGAMRAMGAIVNLLFGKMMDIGRALFDAFSNPKKLLSDLVQFIQDQVVNRFKAFGVAFDAINKIIHGDFKTGLKELADSAGMWSLGVANITDKMAKFGKEVADAAVEGYNFVQIMDDIEDRQAAMEISAKKADILVDQLLLQAKNISKTHEERIALLNQANSVTEKSYTDQLKLSKEYLDAVNKEIDTEKKQQGVEDDTDEQRDKRKDAELAYLNLLGQETQVKEKISNRSAQIFEQDQKLAEKNAAERQKLADAEAKAYEDQVKVWQKVEDTKIELMNDGREKDLASLNLSLQRQIEALDVNAPTYAAALAAAQELGRKQRSDINAKWDKDEQQKLQDKLNKENELQLITEVNGLNERYLAGQLSQREYLAAQELAVKNSEQRKLDLIKKAHGVESKEYQDQYKKILDQNTKFGENQAQMVQQAALGTVNSLGNIFGQLAAMQNQGSEEAKALMVAQAIMSTIAGSINAYTSTAQIPLVGAVLAPIAAGVAFAAGIANVEKIENTEVPKSSTTKKAAAGMVLTGPSHAGGGIDVNAEGDEIILTKNVYRNPMLRNIASRINVAAGGRSFETGGPVSPFDISRGPIASGRAGQGATNPLIDYDRLGTVIDQKMENKIMKIQVHNNVQDTQAGIQVINGIKNEANT